MPPVHISALHAQRQLWTAHLRRGTRASCARSLPDFVFTSPFCIFSHQVHQTFLEIARTEGSKSMDRKKGLINKLLVAAKENEAGYIMRCLQVLQGGCTVRMKCAVCSS